MSFKKNADPAHASGRPIYIIGAGGIVNDAHLPAYRLAGYNVAGIYDVNHEKALTTADRFSIRQTFESLDKLVTSAEQNAVFDIAVPASSIIDVLHQLPGRSPVLIQKPMGANLEEANKILELTRNKQQIAAVNFQLRYAAAIQSARNMIDAGLLGDLYDIEVNVNVYTPWHLWDFLYNAPRVEILYHSIHYIDLVRSFLGNPVSVYAKTVKHPAMARLASVRSSIIMDYGDEIRANLLTNHCHQFGPKHQQSYIKLEGTKGAIKITLGVLQNYPKGEPDSFEYVYLDENGKGEWKSLEIDDTWFPHAFIGSMTQVLLAADKFIETPDNSVEDCINTMACVEAAYLSSEAGGVRLDEVLNRPNNI
jgi:predicted dehydrogenase